MLCIRFVRVLAFAILVFLLGSIGMDAKRPIAAPHSLPGFGVDQADRGPGMPALPITVKKWKELAPPVPETNPRRGPNVRLNAVLSPGSERLTEGLLWRIMKVDASKPDEDEQELIWSGGGAEPQLTLKPGRYYAEATFGLAKDGLEFELARDQAVTQVVSLNAGTLHVHGAALAGGAPLSNVFFTLRKAGNEGGEPEDIGRSSLPNAVFHVPAGEYRLIARHGLAMVDLPVSVSAGEEKRLEAVLNTGEITLSAHAKADGPLMSGVTFLVYENGEAGRHREIIRSKLGEPTFSLPAGHYRIAAVLGLAQIEQDINVKAGEQKRQALVLNAGGVRLQASLAGRNEPLDRNLLYRIFSLSGKAGSQVNKEILTSTLASPTIFLPQGRYRIESQYGWHNARQTKDIEIAAGDVLTADFQHKVSDVKLRLVPRPGAAPMGRVKWTLKYNGGGTVLIAQDAAPALILQAGHYQAVAQHEAKTYSQTFEAIPNEEQTIEVVAQ
jgi:hypothetical protein